MKELPNITMVCVDTVNYGAAAHAIYQSLTRIKPARTIFFTDINFPDDHFEVVNIKHLFSKKDYSKFIVKELAKHIHTDFVLIIQHDGFVLDETQWDDEFAKYDYVGAPWLYVDGANVGNGGFSLRSKRLMDILAQDDFILPMDLEDDGICRTYRPYLRDKYGITWAPEELADKFSFELREPKTPTFGFHGGFHPPYRPVIVFKRTAAMGDVIQIEPLLELAWKGGARVVLDTPASYYALFAHHYFPVEHYDRFDKVVHHTVINLDMAYEVMPKQLHLKSYMQVALGDKFQEGFLRNPKLNFTGNNAFFENYVVIHIDERETKHRNIYGVDWNKVCHHLADKGYLVIQIGKGVAPNAGVRFNTVNEAMMMWLIAKCEFFIGVDSGPSNMAVALGKKCVIFFGSVNPQYIYHDLSNIVELGSECPILHDHCWHETIGVRGTDCQVEDAPVPPCCEISTFDVIRGIKKCINLLENE